MNKISTVLPSIPDETRPMSPDRSRSRADLAAYGRRGKPASDCKVQEWTDHHALDIEYGFLHDEQVRM